MAAITDHPRPTRVKEVQNFSGVINFYRKFVPGAANTLKPLTDTLKGSPRPKSVVESTGERVVAYKVARTAQQKAAHLAFRKQDAEIALMVDATGHHVGVALQQREGPAVALQTLGFFSKKLKAAQTRNLAYDRELLACVLGIPNFRFMVEGRKFTAHRPLTFALSKAAEAWTARQAL